jgi:hypothetical protein
MNGVQHTLRSGAPRVVVSKPGLMVSYPSLKGEVVCAAILLPDGVGGPDLVRKIVSWHAGCTSSPILQRSLRELIQSFARWGNKWGMLCHNNYETNMNPVRAKVIRMRKAVMRSFINRPGRVANASARSHGWQGPRSWPLARPSAVLCNVLNKIDTVCCG